MKKLLTILTISSTIVLQSCKQSGQEQTNSESISTLPKLQVRLSSVSGVDEKQITKDSNYVIDSDYFEVGLYSVSNGAKFRAERKIEEPKSIENFKLVTLYVVDSTNKPISFKNSTDFLNFMSERGYEMKDQQKFEFHTDYTFKKK